MHKFTWEGLLFLWVTCKSPAPSHVHSSEVFVTHNVEPKDSLYCEPVNSFKLAHAAHMIYLATCLDQIPYVQVLLGVSLPLFNFHAIGVKWLHQPHDDTWPLFFVWVFGSHKLTYDLHVLGYWPSSQFLEISPIPVVLVGQPENIYPVTPMQNFRPQNAAVWKFLSALIFNVVMVFLGIFIQEMH